MRIRRPLAIAATALVLSSGVIAGTATAATADDHRGSGHGQRPGHDLGSALGHGKDRWLESHVDRTATDGAKSALAAAMIEARTAYRAALEAAGSDEAAREAARVAYAADRSTAYLAFDTATLPVDQVAPVTAYRAAMQAAEGQLRDDILAAKSQLKIITDPARATFQEAMQAATTFAERRAAIDAFRAAVEPARDAFKVQLTAAQESVLASVQAARAALEAAIPSV